jgi:hypothetical protein
MTLEGRAERRLEIFMTSLECALAARAGAAFERLTGYHRGAERM